MISTNNDIFKTKTFQLKRDNTFKDCPKLTEMVKKTINSGVFQTIMCHSLNLFFLSHLNHQQLCVFLEKSRFLFFIIQNAHLLFITASPVCFLGKKLYDVLSMTTIYYNILLFDVFFPELIISAGFFSLHFYLLFMHMVS